jgi:NADPH2:quinone reductase
LCAAGVGFAHQSKAYQENLMRAMVLVQENEFPQLQSVPDPVPGERELLVKVEAAGINYADTMMRRGFYIQKPVFPYIPGFEFSGTVVGLGPACVPSWQGARVMGLCQSAYAEYLTLAEAQAIPIPNKFSYEQAAAFPVVFLTAYAMLKISAKAVPGETILIHAAGGGVGTAAIQLAKKMGLAVIATASSDEKLERVKALGADFTVNYKKRDFVEPVLQFTQGRGVNVVFESSGGDFLDKDIDATAPFGRIVVFGMAGGTLPPPDLAKMFKHSISVTAFWLLTLTQQPARFKLIVQELMDFVDQQEIGPVVGKVYPLKDAAEALKALESRQTYGKLVLKP